MLGLMLGWNLLHGPFTPVDWAEPWPGPFVVKILW